MSSGSVLEQADAERRARQQQMWDRVAPSWAARADEVEALATSMTARLIEMAAPRQGERVLELACGPGGLGVEVARRLGGAGEVVLSDISPEMLAAAAARARDHGLGDVSTRQLDLEDIAEPAGSYDLVLCREGLMFAHDPVRAGREIRRVLRPGGRAIVSVWAAPDRNPWLAIPMQAAGAELGRPLPPPEIPGPFSLGEPGRLDAVLADAGLEDVVVEELAASRPAPSFEDWWERTVALAGPMAGVLAAQPPETRAAIVARARHAAAAYETDEGLEFPGVTLVASARRAA